MRELTLKEVEILLKEAVGYCQSIGRPSSVAVVDMGGHLRGLLRPEKGRISNILFAEKKAWTAVAFQRPTDMVREIMVPGAMAYGLQHTDGRICIVGGGYPLIDEAGDVIGGIGVSGGLVEEDQEACLAGMRKLGFRTEFINPLAPQEPKDQKK
ncbi:MAG: heme-binding protein [candidate division NC10 bacterium]|nr:heme-binding protein [candidate division NC10 bacterium]